VDGSIDRLIEGDSGGGALGVSITQPGQNFNPKMSSIFRMFRQDSNTVSLVAVITSCCIHMHACVRSGELEGERHQQLHQLFFWSL